MGRREVAAGGENMTPHIVLNYGCDVPLLASLAGKQSIHPCFFEAHPKATSPRNPFRVLLLFSLLKPLGERGKASSHPSRWLWVCSASAGSKSGSPSLASPGTPPDIPSARVRARQGGLVAPLGRAPRSLSALVSPSEQWGNDTDLEGV